MEMGEFHKHKAERKKPDKNIRHMIDCVCVSACVYVSKETQLTQGVKSHDCGPFWERGDDSKWKGADNVLLLDLDGGYRDGCVHFVKIHQTIQLGFVHFSECVIPKPY